MKELTIKEWLQEDEAIADRIIENNSDINIDYDWFDFTIEDFIESSEKLGFYITKDKVQFSGFFSQGDGASFTGYIDIKEYLKASKQLTKFRPLVRAIDNNLINEYVSIERTSHHYSHECTCSVDDIEIYEDLTLKVEDLCLDLYNILEEERKDLCLDLYKELRDNYEGLTSRESIIDTLNINNYKFNEDGEII